MHELDTRNRIDLALWHLTRGLGHEVVSLDSGGQIVINQAVARDVHLIRSAWPVPGKGESPTEDVYCARTLLARCESPVFRGLPARRLASAIRDALELH